MTRGRPIRVELETLTTTYFLSPPFNLEFEEQIEALESLDLP